MSQPEAAKLNGNWKALFICHNPKVNRDLAALFSHHLPSFSAHDMEAYPTRLQLANLFAAESLKLCLLEITEPHEKALAVIGDLLRVDSKLPIVAVLPGNDPELILRCLRQ